MSLEIQVNDARPNKDQLQNALILIDHADYTLAVQLLQGLVTRKPDFGLAYQWLGYCHKQLGIFQKALFYYEKHAELDPCEETFFNLADIYYLMGKDVEAGAFYKKTLSFIDYDSPFLFQIYKNLGNINVRLRDFDTAEENYDRAYTINPHSDDLYVNYGTLELQKEHYDLALQRFQQALNLNFFNDKAWVGLALIYRDRGDFQLAWGDLLKAIDINIYNQTALKFCVDWALQDMNYEPARDAVERYLKVEPQNADWTYTLAGMYFQLGQWTDALREAHKVLDIQPEFAPAKELIRILDLKLEN